MARADGCIKAGLAPWWFFHGHRSKSIAHSPQHFSAPLFFTQVLLGAHRKDAKGTHVHVLSSPPSFLGWHAILRPLQKKHARNGSFFGCFFPRLPRRGEPSSSSSPCPSHSPPRPWPFGSRSGYVMKVNVCCRMGLRGRGVDDGDEENPLKTEERLDFLALAISSSGRWPIGDRPRGRMSIDSELALRFIRTRGVGGGASAGAGGASGAGATYWSWVAGAYAASYGCCCSWAGAGAYWGCTSPEVPFS